VNGGGHKTLRRRARVGAGVGVPRAFPLDTIDPAFWTPGPFPAYDPLTIVNGAVTVSVPSTGGNVSAGDAAAHGLAYHDFGPGYGDHVKLGFYWSMERPGEASPIAHVDLGEVEGGMGMYPASDIIQPGGGVGANGEPAWFLGTMGDTNANVFIPAWNSVRAWDAFEISRWGQGGDRALIEMVSSAGELEVFIDGHFVVAGEVPPALRGVTVHGFSVDNNQVHVTPGDTTDPFDRIPDWPSGYGPFTIERI